MRISFKNIQTREELLTRVENGVLSVGCWLNNIRHLMTLDKTNDDQVQIEVIYSSMYGNSRKSYFI